MMTATEVLRRARALIEEPARWCRDKYARDERGRSIRPGSERACQWCALGAVRAVTSGIPANEVQPIYREAIRRLQRALNPEAPGAQSGIVDANDRKATSHADVLAAFDVAIGAAP